MEKIEELFRQNPNLERVLRPSPDELAGLSSSIEILREALNKNPDDKSTVFQLGASLISHSRQSFIEEGINLMQALVCTRWQSIWSEKMGEQKAMEELYGRDYSTMEEEIDRKKASKERAPRGVVSDTPSAPQDSDMEESEVSPLTSDEEREVEATIYREALGGGDAVPPQLLTNKNTSHIAPDHMDDLGIYHYYLALGWIKLREFQRARSCITQMLLLAPHNKQGNALKRYIEVAERRETAVNATATLAGASLVLAGVGTILGLVMRGRNS